MTNQENTMLAVQGMAYTSANYEDMHMIVETFGIEEMIEFIELHNIAGLGQLIRELKYSMKLWNESADNASWGE